MDAVMKGLVIAIGIYDTMLWRSLIAVGFSALLWVCLHRRRPTRAALRLHLVRGAVSTAIAMLFFWGLGRVPLAQAIALTYRSEEHTSELQSLMRISYAVFCLQKKKTQLHH